MENSGFDWSDSRAHTSCSKQRVEEPDLYEVISMRHDRPAAAACARIALVLVTTSSLGCFAHSRGEIDWDEHPVVNTGAGATILYPGQTAPTYSTAGPGQTTSGPPNQLPPGGPGGAPVPGGSVSNTSSGPGGERRSGSPQPAGPPITMIGGAEQDIEGHLSWKQEPAWWKYLALPFAVIAAPFKAAADVAQGEPDAGPAIPESELPGLEAGGSGAAPPPAPRADPLSAPQPHSQRLASPPPERSRDYESAMVDKLERELEDRRHRSESRGAGANSTADPSRRRGSAAPSLSIAAELAALQRSPDVAAAGRLPEPTPSGFASAAHPPPPPSADGVVDRDGDGRIDQWIYRVNGEIARIELDETSDGRVDRTLHYDLATHQIARVEEDSNGDGVSDSWTDYEGGRVARRRGDDDHDGSIDSWSFYDEGVITRHEQDSDGDGFRDRTGFYVGGKLAREEHDRNGDGRSDTAIQYDERERVSRREEDNDNDGRPDVISYFEAGKLSRRELLHYDDDAETARP